ncbi:MAG: polysaccharide deacetylase family protein, partial [Burkholderia sp.]|nr:polysaccharide deacetylase family protein [Burkholderia sp.]
MNAPSSIPSHQAAETRRWKPTPLIAGTAALHAGAAAAVIAQPATWPWAAGGV